MNDQEFSKQNLLAKISAGRDEFETTLARVPEQETQTPILHDGWSVQDVLGHLVFWEESVVSRLNILRAGQRPDPVVDIDALNAQILADFHRLPLDEVRRREREAYRQILAMVESATDEELFEPGYFSGTNDNPFIAWIAGNTWGHYEEHLPELQAWLDGNVKS
jgi:hypothetical protein